MPFALCTARPSRGDQTPRSTHHCRVLRVSHKAEVTDYADQRSAPSAAAPPRSARQYSTTCKSRVSNRLPQFTMSRGVRFCGFRLGVWITTRNDYIASATKQKKKIDRSDLPVCTSPSTVTISQQFSDERLQFSQMG